MMDAIDESRSALANAIDEFRVAEVAYLNSVEACDAAARQVHAAIREGSGADLSRLIEAQSRASLARGEAREALAEENSKVITRANLTVEAAAGQAMRIAIDDFFNRDPDVVALRDWRNKLLKDAGAGAPLVSAAG